MPSKKLGKGKGGGNEAAQWLLYLFPTKKERERERKKWKRNENEESTGKLQLFKLKTCSLAAQRERERERGRLNKLLQSDLQQMREATISASHSLSLPLTLQQLFAYILSVFKLFTKLNDLILIMNKQCHICMLLSTLSYIIVKLLNFFINLTFIQL